MQDEIYFGNIGYRIHTLINISYKYRKDNE